MQYNVHRLTDKGYKIAFNDDDDACAWQPDSTNYW